MDGGLWHCIEGSDQDHPLEKEMQKATWLSEEALQVAEKRRQQKEKENRKDIPIWMQSSKEQQGGIRKPSSVITAKNIINLISVLNTWWCPCVESCVACWKRVFAVTSGFSWQNSISLCPASFCTPGPNLPVTAGISWLPTLRERQRRKGKIYPFECRVPKNRKERLESLPQWSVQRNRGKQ